MRWDETHSDELEWDWMKRSQDQELRERWQRSENSELVHAASVCACVRARVGLGNLAGSAAVDGLSARPDVLRRTGESDGRTQHKFTAESILDGKAKASFQEELEPRSSTQLRAAAVVALSGRTIGEKKSTVKGNRREHVSILCLFLPA